MQHVHLIHKVSQTRDVWICHSIFSILWSRVTCAPDTFKCLYCLYYCICQLVEWDILFWFSSERKSSSNHMRRRSWWNCLVFAATCHMLLYSGGSACEFCLPRALPLYCSCGCLVAKLFDQTCSPPGSSVHAILQARILEWFAKPFFRGSSWLRDPTCVSRSGR